VDPKVRSQLEKGGDFSRLNSLGGDPVLRGLKNDEVMRPASANRNTVTALETRDLIVQSRGGDPLRIEWQFKKPKT